jgi:S-adenosylmethionine hydrolase
VGPRAERLVEQPAAAGPRVVAIDRFGNLITSIRAAELAARPLRALAIKGHRIPVRGTYADVEPGAAVAVVGSYDLLEIAVCQGSAAALLGAEPGEPVSACEEYE